MIKKVFVALGAIVLLLTLFSTWQLNNRMNILINTPSTKSSSPSTGATTVSVGECTGSGYCLKFKHESELSLPPISNSGCPPYKLPELAKLPAVKELEIGKDTPPDQANEILLKYVEKVLDADSASKATLLKDYQDYLSGCTKSQDAVDPDPSTTTK